MVNLPRLQHQTPIVEPDGTPAPSFHQWWERLATASESALAGALTNGDKGDITVSGSGLVWTIDPAVITFAKMANVATGTIFYRKTAGAGSPEVQTLATLKTDLGLTGTNSGDQTITLTGDVTGTGTASFATTLATVNSNVGSFGSTTVVPVITVNGKGLITAVSTATIAANPWTEKTLTSDFSNSTTTQNTVTDGTNAFSFTPAANSNWEVFAELLIQTATATVLPEVGVNVSAQGTGAYGSASVVQVGATIGSFVAWDLTWTTAAASGGVGAGGLPAANTPYLSRVYIRGHSGASPAAVAITCASETGGTIIKVLAGSQMRTKAS